MTFKQFFYIPAIRRVIALLVVFLVLYISRSMLNLVLITFILTYLVNRLHGFVMKFSGKYFKISKLLAVIVIYVLLVLLLASGIYKYLPMFIDELSDLVNQVISFYNKPPINLPDNVVVNYVMESLKDIDLASYISGGFNFVYHTLTNIGKISLNLFIAIILSLFFMLEKEKVTRFTANFRSSKLSYLFEEFEYFGKKFIQSFGKVIEVQFLISLVNAVLSSLFLWILGFPNLLALGFMIFLLGLVPVMGVFVSLIPLCAIAFKIGGVTKIIYVLIMIVILHGLESYVLNPKFMASKTHLPIFYTFMVLIIAEHFYGVWGLIIGVPVFIFFLDILDVRIVPAHAGADSQGNPGKRRFGRRRKNPPEDKE